MSRATRISVVDVVSRRRARRGAKGVFYSRPTRLVICFCLESLPLKVAFQRSSTVKTAGRRRSIITDIYLQIANLSESARSFQNKKPSQMYLLTS